MKLPFLCVIILLNLSCKKADTSRVETPNNEIKTISYLALGDSYTIGQSVNSKENYPNQLRNRFENDSRYRITEPKIVAQTGWTTQNLTDALAGENIKTNYDLVSLLIGVNNQYQGRDTVEYAIQFEALLNSAVIYANGNKNHVVVISIPDYGFTPFGENNKEFISRQIDIFNAINKRITDRFGITYIDITPISRNTDEALTASDGLHPSAKQYSLWVDKIYPVIKNLLVH